MTTDKYTLILVIGDFGYEYRLVKNNSRQTQADGLAIRDDLSLFEKAYHDALNKPHAQTLDAKSRLKESLQHYDQLMKEAIQSAERQIASKGGWGQIEAIHLVLEDPEILLVAGEHLVKWQDIEQSGQDIEQAGQFFFHKALANKTRSKVYGAWHRLEEPRNNTTDLLPPPRRDQPGYVFTFADEGLFYGMLGVLGYARFQKVTGIYPLLSLLYRDPTVQRAVHQQDGEGNSNTLLVYCGLFQTTLIHIPAQPVKLTSFRIDVGYLDILMQLGATSLKTYLAETDTAKRQADKEDFIRKLMDSAPDFPGKFLQLLNKFEQILEELVSMAGMEQPPPLFWYSRHGFGQHLGELIGEQFDLPVKILNPDRILATPPTPEENFDFMYHNREKFIGWSSKGTLRPISPQKEDHRPGIFATLLGGRNKFSVPTVSTSTPPGMKGKSHILPSWLRTPNPVRDGVSMVFIGLAFLGLAFNAWFEARDRMDNSLQKLETTPPRATPKPQVEVKVAEKRVIWSDKLALLAAATPKTLWLTDVYMSERGAAKVGEKNLVVEGAVKPSQKPAFLADITGFEQEVNRQLLADPENQNRLLVKFDSTKVTRESGKDKITFKIELTHLKTKQDDPPQKSPAKSGKTPAENIGNVKKSQEQTNTSSPLL